MRYIFGIYIIEFRSIKISIFPSDACREMF